MSFLSAILPSDIIGVKFAKLQRQFRLQADNAGIIYNIGGFLQDIRPGDTDGVKWAKLGAWAELNAQNTGGGGVPAGPIGASGLTMNTARILGRTTAGVGAIEEFALVGLTMTPGSPNTLGVAAAQTSITSITSPGALTLATSANGDLNLSPNGTGAVKANAWINTTDAIGIRRINAGTPANIAWLNFTDGGGDVDAQFKAAANGTIYLSTAFGHLTWNRLGVLDGGGYLGRVGNPWIDLWLSGQITTGAPSGGTAAAWKLGSNITSGTSVIDATGYVEIDIGGSMVKLARVTNS